MAMAIPSVSAVSVEPLFPTIGFCGITPPELPLPPQNACAKALTWTADPVTGPDTEIEVVAALEVVAAVVELVVV